MEDAHGGGVRGERDDTAAARRPRAAALLDPAAGVLAGAILLWSAFHAGGFFPDAPGWIAAVCAVLLVLRVSLARHPFAGIGTAGGVAIGALGLFALWTLLSSVWSGAPARALIEFDRALAYTLVLVLFASLPGSRKRLRWLVWSLAAACAVVGVFALLSRLMPDVLTIHPGYVPDRLSYPLTYWNGLGILAAIGLLLNLHLACSEREPVLARVLGSAAVPLLAVTVYFTLSKGAVGAAAVGVLVYLVVGRPRALLTGLPVVGVATALAVRAAYGADRVSSGAFQSLAAQRQGHHVAWVLGVAMAAALVVRLLLALAVDGRLARAAPGPRAARGLTAVGVALALAVVAVLVAVGAPGRVGHEAHQLFTKQAPTATSDSRRHLTDPSNNYRVTEWDVSLRAFRAEPLHGTGAGTYQIRWTRERPNSTPLQRVTDGHSLYLEVLGELGIVGLVLVLIFVLTVLGAFAWGARRSDRALHAALLGAGVAWALHAGIDWDWEMPAVTAWLFAAGGTVLATTPRSARLAVPLPGLARTVAGLAGLLLAILPVRVALSQDRLETAVRALSAGNCATGVDRALASVSALSVRPEPYEVLGFCDARLAPALGVQMMRRAVQRDPQFWEYHYGLAVASAADGRDPRPEIARALALDPLEPVVLQAQAAFRGAKTPREWRRRVTRTRLPIS